MAPLPGSAAPEEALQKPPLGRAVARAPRAGLHPSAGGRLEVPHVVAPTLHASAGPCPPGGSARHRSGSGFRGWLRRRRLPRLRRSDAGTARSPVGRAARPLPARRGRRRRLDQREPAAHAQRRRPRRAPRPDAQRCPSAVDRHRRWSPPPSSSSGRLHTRPRARSRTRPAGPAPCTTTRRRST